MMRLWVRIFAQRSSTSCLIGPAIVLVTMSASLRIEVYRGGARFKVSLCGKRVNSTHSKKIRRQGGPHWRVLRAPERLPAKRVPVQAGRILPGDKNPT